MTAWEALVAKSALATGTAMEHLLSIKEMLGTVFLSKSSVVVASTNIVVVEPALAPAPPSAALSADPSTHPFTTTEKHFCLTRERPVFVLMRRKTER